MIRTLLRKSVSPLLTTSVLKKASRQPAPRRLYTLKALPPSGPADLLANMLDTHDFGQVRIPRNWQNKLSTLCIAMIMPKLKPN
mmetsp:Transcript_14482/g.39217  ORF Transcript_14482/g.39217 Transcript_14482/m.39217 type:complete len:84 (+) Transcript_14482:36-287(+)